MKYGRRVIYWDACVVIAWVKEEILDAAIVEGMQQTVTALLDGEVLLITSLLTRMEVLASSLKPGEKKRYDSLFAHENALMVEIGLRVIDRGHEIRDYYFQARKGLELKSLETTDCIHLSTAIISDADEFHTLDGMGSKKAGKILSVGKIIAEKYPLDVKIPHAEQPSLLTNIPAIAETLRAAAAIGDSSGTNPKQKLLEGEKSEAGK